MKKNQQIIPNKDTSVPIILWKSGFHSSILAFNYFLFFDTFSLKKKDKKKRQLKIPLTKNNFQYFK